MCLIAWNWQPNRSTPLLLLGNRDEFYARPAQALHRWNNGDVLAGKDLQAGGTWLGVGRGGRMAALTNYRVAHSDSTVKPSRGELTTRFLQGSDSAHRYLSNLAATADQYNPFNLLVWDTEVLMGLESRTQRVLKLLPGIGAVSNADFDTPWPKLERLKAGLEQRCLEQRTAVEDLLPLLQDRQIAADHLLPRTGIAITLERTLSATFIAGPAYGTRASSIVTVGCDKLSFFEQSYDENGARGAVQLRLSL